MSPKRRDTTPEEELDAIVASINSSPEPDFVAIEEAGAGPLETLFLFGHEEALWHHIERLAREDERFRRALSVVWAFDSPLYERRQQLLRELGEHRPVTVRLTLVPRTFDDTDGFTWRDFEVEGVPERPHLAAILRGIAAHLDEPPYEPHVSRKPRSEA
jgi:hypothetical protein